MLQWMRLRVNIELASVILRTLVTAFLVLVFKQSLIAFALAQVSPFIFCSGFEFYENSSDTSLPTHWPSLAPMSSIFPVASAHNSARLVPCATASRSCYRKLLSIRLMRLACSRLSTLKSRVSPAQPVRTPCLCATLCSSIWCVPLPFSRPKSWCLLRAKSLRWCGVLHVIFSLSRSCVLYAGWLQHRFSRVGCL